MGGQHRSKWELSKFKKPFDLWRTIDTAGYTFTKAKQTIIDIVPKKDAAVAVVSVARYSTRSS
jgi:hypothetical protein